MSSHKKNVNITCPSCNKEQSVIVYQIADASQEPEINTYLYNGQLHMFECINCGAKLHYNDYMLYADKERGLLINVFSEKDILQKDQIISRIFKDLSTLSPNERLPNYIVFGYHQLAKIISLIENKNSVKNIRESEELYGPELYYRVFVLSEEWIKCNEDPEYIQNSKKAEPYFNTALKMHKNKNIEEAIKHYEETIKICPLYFNANFNLGMIYSNLSDKFKMAEELFLVCRDLRPNDRDVVFSCGKIFLEQQKLDSARQCFENTLILSPESSLGWFNLGLCCAMQQNTQQGLECLETSHELASSDADKNLINRVIKQVTDNMI